MLSTIKEKRNKIVAKFEKSRIIIIGSLLIAVGLGVIISNFVYKTNVVKIENQMMDEFFQDKPNIVVVNESGDIVKNSSDESYYIGVLEIPSISLKKGLVDINSKNNNVNRNIQIIEHSTYPNVVNGNLILAGHSGSGIRAYFRNIHKLSVGDESYVYYNGIKYIYQVVNIYKENKDGDILIHRDKDKTILTLTTCDTNDKSKQLIIISELINTEDYGG